MMLSNLARKARNFARRPRFEQAWFVPAWLLLGVCRFVILFVPFRKLAPHLGRHAGIAPWVPLATPAAEARASAISRVIQMAASHTPWTSNCFPQAVAARILLRLYGIPCSLFFGVDLDAADTALQAHAWVACGRTKVTGGDGFGRFNVVGCFVAPGLSLPGEQLDGRSGATGTDKKGS